MGKKNTEDNLKNPIDNIDRSHKGISLAQLIELRTKGNSYQDIAKIVGCTPNNVWLRLKDYKNEIDSLEELKNNRPDLFAVIQSKLLNSIGTDDINSMTVLQRTTAACQLYDKERLERGQATENIDIHALTESLE